MTTTHPASAPPASIQIGPIAWLRKNLFSSWFNSILTLILGVILGKFLFGFIIWSTTTAKWEVIPANLPLFFVGRFPASQYWRIWAIVTMIALLSGLSWGILSRNVAKLFSNSVLIWTGIIAVILFVFPLSVNTADSSNGSNPILYRLLLLITEGLVLGGAWVGRLSSRKYPVLGKWLPLAWVLSFFLTLWLLMGGLGLLETVNTTDWGGLLLTVFMSVVSIVLCFPLGILLALGRQSNLPVVRWLSIIFIEVVRGIPLIAILFVGFVMLPLVLPTGVRPDLVARAILGLTLFSAAYLAENVRGGLQSIPKGQAEAANALGLNPALTIALIVLPQALKVSIPAMVGQFISLLQDTTLVAILGLFELLGISRAVLANPLFVGRYAEVYIFIGVIYWIVCYAMSLGSRRLEQQFNTGH